VHWSILGAHVMVFFEVILLHFFLYFLLALFTWRPKQSILLGIDCSSIAISLCGLFLLGLESILQAIRYTHLLVVFCSKDLLVCRLPKAWRSGFQIWKFTCPTI
jgi:hypothetical protein